MPHDEELHPEVAIAERRVERRRAKKRRRMRIAGKSVFLLQTQLRRGPKSRRSQRRRARRAARRRPKP